MKEIPKLVPTWERFFILKIYIDLGPFGFLGGPKKLENRKKRGAKTLENQNSQVGTNLGKIQALFFQGFHPLVEHLNEPVQEPGPAALSGTDIDKSVVVIP